jgi:molecular chaperone HscB
MQFPDYYTFFGVAPSFQPDPQAIKQAFLEHSQELHPDRYTLATPAEQEQALIWSAFNNQAYATLSHPIDSIAYLLKLKGYLEEEGKAPAPSQDFLMQVMDYQEAIMELEFEPSPEQAAAIKAALQELETSLYTSVKSYLQASDAEQLPTSAWEQVKNFFHKLRYLLRMKENLATFVPL